MVGLIAGILMPKQTPVDLLEHTPMQEGKILEFIVSSHSRGGGVGSKLLEAMEDHFRKRGCAYIHLQEVFAPNSSARSFYAKRGYTDRFIEMIKPL